MNFLLRNVKQLSNLDSNQTVFFLRELEAIKSKTFDEKQRPLKSASLIPVDTSAGAGAANITYRSYSAIGLAKLISNYADDIPMVDVFGEEVSIKVFHIAAGYKYDVFEIKQAARSGTNLESRKATMANKAIDTKIDQIAWFGLSAANIQGFIDYPGIQEYSTPNGATSGTPQWSTKTADEIIADLNGMVQAVKNSTNGVENPNQIIVPLKQYGQISTVRFSDSSDLTILEYFKRNNPGVTVSEVVELKHGGGTTVDRAMAYVKDPDHLTQEVPVPKEQHEPEKEGLAFKIPMTADVAGVIVYYPLSVIFADNI